MKGRPITVHCSTPSCRRALALWQLRQMRDRGGTDALFYAALIAYGVTEAELPTERPGSPERVPGKPTRQAWRHRRMQTLTCVKCPECGHEFETTL